MSAHPALRIDRLFHIVAQSANPHRQSRCEQRQRQRADQQHGDHDVEQPFERAIALRENAVARFLDDHDAAYLIAKPDRMCGRHDGGASIGCGAALRCKDARQRAFDVAAARRSLRDGVVFEFFGRLFQDALIERVRDRLHDRREAARRFAVDVTLVARPLECARARQHDAVAVDHPDPRGRSRQSLHDLRDIG